ncbi:MAG: ATP-dependent RecD-like DNA helicase [Clostridia bacterium]|nr:ATP-dependent RecD-like DNA helicase [Clostridia bacterium]
MPTLSGIIEKVIYQNRDNGYTVAALETPDGEITVVGLLPLVAEGEQIEVEGEFKLNPKHGQQFEVSSFLSRLPVEETAILRYLSSGIVKGVRAKTAKLLVDAFGPNTLDVIENDPEQLVQIRGISPEKAERISQSMKETVGVKTILLYFQQFGMTPSVAFKIYKQFGLRAYDAVRANPYRICEIPGVSFEKADRMAEQMGFDRTSDFRIKAGIEYILNQNLYNNGHTFIPRAKLIPLAAEFLDTDRDTVTDRIDDMCGVGGELYYLPQIGNTDGVYLRWVYESEKNITNRVLLASRLGNEYEGNFKKDIARIERDLNIEFDEKQKKAVKESCCHQMMILTGGPGTGKTTTLNGIIRILESKGEKVGLATPTGRAAKRITELTGREAKTIHRLLEYTQNGTERCFQRNHGNPVDYDAVIIDECSMVDLWLFDHLLDALPISARLILVGDVNQLPPVGPGSVLKDILNSDCVPSVELTEIFRQARESLIITNAHAVLHGEMPVLNETKNDFFFLRAAHPQAAVDLAVDLAAQRLPAAYGFDPTADIQILSPTRKGTCGTAALNQALRERINPPAYNKKELTFRDIVFREGDKVMQIRNNYDLITEKDDGTLDAGIYNGDLGIIETVIPAQESLIVRFDDKRVTYTNETLEELEPAYAITVHKSQGSEFKAVILTVSEGADVLFTRNLLYTAMTRAKQLLILVGSVARLTYMINNVTADKRYSGLKFMLKALN